MLSLAVTGVLAGCRSLTAIREHTTDLTAADLEALGLQVGQALPSESTIRRVLQDLDPTNLDTQVRSWLCTRSGTIEGRTVIAVDGKTMRAARTGKDPAPHLLAALDQATGTVLAQARVADKSNEIHALRELLKPLDLDGVWWRAPMRCTPKPIPPSGPAQQGGHYVLTPLGSQKTLRRTLKKLLGQGRPVHLLGRLSRATSAAHRPRRPGLPPGWTSPERLRWSGSGAPEPPRIAGARATTAAIAPKGRLWRWSTRVGSLPMGQAQPEQVAAWVRGHWKIDNRLHVGP